MTNRESPEKLKVAPDRQPSPRRSAQRRPEGLDEKSIQSWRSHVCHSFSLILIAKVPPPTELSPVEEIDRGLPSAELVACVDVARC